MPLKVNLLDVLQKVTEGGRLGLHLGAPKHELDKIWQDFRTTERKKGMLQWWLDHTHNPTWEKVKHALRAIGKPKLADAVTRMSQCVSLHEPCEEDLQRWEVILKKIESLDTKLQNLQQHSEDIEREWEKGEKNGGSI